MHVNDLPDDCVLLFFKYFNILEDLIPLSQVCTRWRRLISYRLEKTDYLISVHRKLAKNYKNSPIIAKMIFTKKLEPLLELKLDDLLPNLKILELLFRIPLDCLKYINESVKGLFYPTYYEKTFIKEFDNYRIGGFEKFFPNLEMIAVFGKMDPFLPDSSLAKKLKQIYIDDTNFGAMFSLSESLPNLKRLHVDAFYHDSETYEGPKFQSVKILELRNQSTGRFFGFQNIDSCPVLQSAFLFGIGKSYYINPTIINENLRDLVIENTKTFLGQTMTWLKFLDLSELRIFLTKFPNLEHFALRGNHSIVDSDVNSLLEFGPKLKLLDFRGSKSVTSKSLHYAHRHRIRTGRSVVIYYDCPEGHEPSDWPPIDRAFKPIAQEFDFMENCFFKTFDSLPYLLDSEDPSY